MECRDGEAVRTRFAAGASASLQAHHNFLSQLDRRFIRYGKRATPKHFVQSGPASLAACLSLSAVALLAFEQPIVVM